MSLIQKLLSLKILVVFFFSKNLIDFFSENLIELSTSSFAANLH